MFNILLPNDYQNQQNYYTMFFELNQTQYKIVDKSCHNIDIIVLNPNSDYNEFLEYLTLPSSLKINFEIFHNYETQIKNIYYNYYDINPVDVLKQHSCYTITNAIDFSEELHSKYILHNDFLFNRTKAYYSNFVFRCPPWYYAGRDAYKIPKETPERQKIYIAPNIKNKKYRARLIDHLVNNFFSLGYLSSHDELDFRLASQVDYPELSLDQLVDLKSIKYPSTGYSPAHTAYYQDTFISIYGETIETGSTIAITEKTYDPMIKGHFILPFSTSGFIEYLQVHGFKVPDFIDYSYDSIVDDELRFDCYVNEINRLMLIPLDQWHQYRKDNYVSIIKHNQDLFFNKQYDLIDFKKYITH